jgi:hypothetical protein
MRSAKLHAALREFADQAGVALTAAVTDGAEVAYEVVREGGRAGRPPLHCYHALTSEFIDEQSETLRKLPGYSAAVHALAALDGLATYLDAHGVAHPGGDGPRELAEITLCHFAARIFDGCGQEFAVRPERFAAVYRDLEHTALEGRTQTVVLALMRGIGAESEEVSLGDGALLAPPECLEQLPPDPAWLGERGPSLIVAIAPGDGPGAVGRALNRLCDLQTAMRLFAQGIGLEPIAWVRGEGTPWRPLPILAGGRRDGQLIIAPDQEDELRAFCNLIARRRPASGLLAWALERFELGCQREDPLSGFSDHLIALRALLEPEGPRSGRLATRLAVLCAVPDEQLALAERVARAISLERSVVCGQDPISADAVALAGEVESHLRALLRDVVCGHLRPPLDELADELLGAAGGPSAPHDEPAAPDEQLDGEAALSDPPVVGVVAAPPVAERTDASTDVDGEPGDAGEAYDDLEAWGEPAPLQPQLFRELS